MVNGLVRICKRRGKVKVSSYCMREKRWENEDYFCNFCKRWVGVREFDHYESWCKGIPGTPTSSGQSVYIASRCGRFRHLRILPEINFLR